MQRTNYYKLCLINCNKLSTFYCTAFLKFNKHTENRTLRKNLDKYKNNLIISLLVSLLHDIIVYVFNKNVGKFQTSTLL